MRKFNALLVALACISCTGCDRGASSGNGPVAIVDLDAVAQKLGKDKQILQMIEERQLNLNEQVAKTQSSLIQQLNQKKDEFGELSDEESKQLVQLQNQANSILNKARSQAQSNLNSYQQEVVNRFRAQAKPIAMELAAQKGCRVVLSKNDSVVFAFDEAVDLTDAVATRMKSTTVASVPTPEMSEASTKQATASATAAMTSATPTKSTR